MSPERFSKLKAILADTLELPVETQIEYVTELCGKDIELLNDIKALLNTEMKQDFLNQPAIEIHDLGQAIPVRIGRIKIVRLIAEGGMGKVYAGIDEVLKRQVAIKVMHAEQRASAERRSAFLNEAQALSCLHHPNICQIYDFFIEDDKDILVLEYIDGITLRAAQVTDKLSNPLNIALQIITALTTAHEHGIVHRDLKPDNVMITHSGQIKILDFGLAKMRPLTEDHHTTESIKPIDEQAQANLTQVSGTPGYMSPEQAQGIHASAATDLWSFGIILYEMLSNKKPHPAQSSISELLKRTREGQFEVPVHMPRDQRNLIIRLLDKNPANRPSARTTFEALKRIIDKPKRRIKIAAIITLAVITLFSVWKYTYDLNQERNMAIQASNRAVEARNQAEALVDYMLNDLYIGLRAVGRTDLLESAASQALQYYGNLGDEQMTLTRGKPAAALLQIAEVFGDRGDQIKAISILDTAIDKLHKLHLGQPTDELIMYRLGDAYLAAADILKIAGQLELAKRYAKDATEIGQSLTAGLTPGLGPDEAPNGTDRWRILLRAIYLNADGHMRLGQRAAAIKLLNEIVDKAITATDNNSDLAINLSDIQFKRCGTYYDDNAIDLLLEPCLATFELDRNFYEAKPNDYQLLKNFVADHGVIANVYRKLGQLDKGLEVAKAGIALGEQLILWDQKNDNTLNEFVTVLLALGRLQTELGLNNESQQTFTRALEIIGPVAADQDEISHMNSHFIALLMLGKIDQARKVATVLQSHGFKRRDFQDLCNEFSIQECQINQTSGSLP